MISFHRAAPWRLVMERLSSVPLLNYVERQFYCGMRPFLRRAEKIMKLKSRTSPAY